MNYVLKQIDPRVAKEKRASEAFKVGMTLYGHCDGVFGEDSLDDKVIVEILGNYLEVRCEDGRIREGLVKSWIDLLEASNKEVEMREQYDK
jgi:hypothetical protein